MRHIVALAEKLYERKDSVLASLLTSGNFEEKRGMRPSDRRASLRADGTHCQLAALRRQA